MTETTMLEGVQLWDGMRPRGLSTISWTDEGPGGEMTEIAGATKDSGLSVIPGLVDTHVHLAGNASSTPAEFLTWPLITRPEEQVLHALAHARRALAGGVTTLRDLSANEVQFSLARAIDQGLVEGPRVLAYGMVSMTGGHGDMFTPAAVTHRPPVADGPDACRTLVRHWARAGADGIKIATSGGVLSIGDKAAWRNHSAAEIDAIVDEAHALGMRVAAHAHTPESVDIALDHGVDSIEHATVLPEVQARRVVSSGITIAPTLLINDRIASGIGATEEQAAKARDLIASRNAFMRAAADLGVDFVLGTDANGFHVQFGEQMREVREMASAFGWSPDRALQAATSRAAGAVGRPDLGRLEPGLPADFVVLRGRPWESIEELNSGLIVAVVSHGRKVTGQLP